MAIQDRIAAAAAPFLEPGEAVQVAFVAQTASSWWVLLGFVPFLLLNQYRCVVVTDRRILVLDAGRLTSTKPKSVIRALSRSTRIGPAQGLWYVTANLGETLRIHKRFHKDIEAADARAAAASSPPPPPPPPPA